MNDAKWSKFWWFTAAVIQAFVMGVIAGMYINPHEPTRAEILQKLSMDERRAIAIDYESQYGSWKSTLHNPCNFSPMDADKEKTK